MEAHRRGSDGRRRFTPEFKRDQLERVLPVELTLAKFPIQWLSDTGSIYTALGAERGANAVECQAHTFRVPAFRETPSSGAQTPGCRSRCAGRHFIGETLDPVDGMNAGAPAIR